MKPLLKKISCTLSLILAMAIVVASCFPINVLASESVQNGQSMTFNYAIDINDILFPYESNMPIYPDAEHSHPLNNEKNLVYFYHLFNKVELFTSSSDIYAYKIRVSVSNVSNNSRGLQSLNICYGTDDEFSLIDDVNCGVSVLENSQYSDYWYVTEYSQVSFNVGLLALFGDVASTGYSIDYHCNLKVEVIPYSIDDYQDEIYNELISIRQELEENGLLTEEIKNLLDSALHNTHNGMSVADELWYCMGSLQNLTSYTSVQYQAIQSIITHLKSVISELEGQTSLLADILEYLRNGSEYQEDIDNFKNESSQKTQELNGYITDMNTVSKPTLNTDVLSQLPSDNMGIVSRLFDCIYVFELPIAMMLYVGLFCVMGYVFFGKR